MKVRFQVWVDEDRYEELKETAKQKDMTVSAYVRDLLYRKSDVELTIDFADVYRYVETIEDLKQKINAILPSIFRSSKIYEQESVIIKQTINQISEKVNDTWRYVTTMRADMYDSVRKKLYQTIRQYSYSKRHTKEALDRLEETILQDFISSMIFKFFFNLILFYFIYDYRISIDVNGIFPSERSVKIHIISSVKKSSFDCWISSIDHHLPHSIRCFSFSVQLA